MTNKRHHIQLTYVIIFIFLMIRHTLRYTLFPYTTLFRSILIDEIHTPDSSRFWIAKSYKQKFEKGLEPEYYDKEFIRDRKSTRLNSSHSQTSYAVFCLKKKIIILVYLGIILIETHDSNDY